MFSPMLFDVQTNCNKTVINMISLFNPNAAELFRTIFHSFEAGIANAISSSKWQEIIQIMKKYTSSKFNF